MAILKKISQKPSLVVLAFLLFLSGISLPTVSKSVQASLLKAEADPSSLIQQGKKFYEQGQFDKAVAIWQQAATQFSVQGERLNQAMALSNLSLTYQQLGEWELAKSTIEQSLTLLQSLDSSSEKNRILAQTLDIQGRWQRATGKSEAATQTWQKAIDIYEKAGNREASILSQINQSKALQDLGLYPRACKVLLKALDIDVKDCKNLTELTLENFNQKLEIVQNKADSVIQFDGLQSLGDLLRVVGDLRLSQTLLESSLVVATNLQSAGDRSVALLSLGNTARAFVERQLLLPPQNQDATILILKSQEASQYYQEAAQASTSLTSQVIAQLNLLSLLLESRDWLGDSELAKASDLWPSIQANLNHLPPSKIAIYAQINLAQSIIKFRRQRTTNQAIFPLNLPTDREIEQILTKAVERAKLLGDAKAEAYAVGSRGTLYEQARQWQLAEDFTKQALDLAPPYTTPDIAYQYSWQLGRIRKAQAETEKQRGNIEKADRYTEGAIAAYTHAFETLQSLRSDLVAVNPELQFSFRDSVEPVYRELVSLNLQVAKSLIRQNKLDESQKPLKQARNVIESLQLAELNNFFQDACVTAKNTQIDNIDRTAAIIYPIILEDQLEVIVTLPGGRLLLYTPSDPIANHPVVTQQELEQILTELRVGERNASLQSLASGQKFLPLAQRVYDWLIRPAEIALKESQAQTLVFILDGELRNLPMAVLHDGNQYLVEKYAIALTPGLQLLNPQPLSQATLRVLIGGATNAPSFQKNNLNPLPSVEQELEQIASTLPQNEKRENESFTKANLQTLINQISFPVVHLATHGQFSSNAERTFILDWNGQINVKDFDNLLRRSDTQRPIELLVLSACETVEGDNRAALGLAGIAVRAGARSTVATLWQVSDESTAVFMSAFYSELAKSKQNINRAEALRRAQLKLLQDRKYQHPFFWAPYVLVGNWQ